MADQLVLTAQQSFDVSDGIDGFLLVEYSYTGKAKVESHDPFLHVPSYELWNLRLGFRFRDYATVVTLWGRNVLDEGYRGVGFDPVQQDGRVVATPFEPATWGVTLRKGF